MKTLVCLMSKDKYKAGDFVRSIKDKDVFMRFDTVISKNKYDIPDQLLNNLTSNINEYLKKKCKTMYFIFDDTVTHFEEFDDQIFMDVLKYMNLDVKVYLYFENQCCHAKDEDEKIFNNGFEKLNELLKTIDSELR